MINYNKKFIHGIAIVTLIIIIFFSIGCTSDTEYNPPSKVEPTSTVEEEQETPTETSTEAPKIQIFNVGDTTTDDELKITVNNVRFTTKIDEQNNEFLVAKAQSGKQYVIIDITIENILPDQTQAISTFGLTSVIDQDGYEYTLDFEGLVALDKSFKDGEVLPGMKKRGEVVYLVPNDVTDLKFRYKFDLFAGTTVIFDIK
ncbi:MAG: DUF4352 domain-containing protein [Methanosarcinales archaeon]|nr:DUF4352 domain-containing protein [Methanosarcinales archaeon]